MKNMKALVRLGKLEHAANPSSYSGRESAITRFDVVILLGAIVVLASVALNRVRLQAQIWSGASCYNRLQTLSSGYITFAVEALAIVTDLSTNQGGTREFANDPRACYRHFAAFSKATSLKGCGVVLAH